MNSINTNSNNDTTKKSQDISIDLDELYSLLQFKIDRAGTSEHLTSSVKNKEIEKRAMEFIQKSEPLKYCDMDKNLHYLISNIRASCHFYKSEEESCFGRFSNPMKENKSKKRYMFSPKLRGNKRAYQVYERNMSLSELSLQKRNSFFNEEDNFEIDNYLINSMQANVPNVQADVTMMDNNFTSEENEADGHFNGESVDGSDCDGNDEDEDNDNDVTNEEQEGLEAYFNCQRLDYGFNDGDDHVDN